MTKEEILDYATTTPENTNRNVLGSMLNSFLDSGGSNDPNYVNVNNLVNPPNASNAGKVVGVGDDGRATLISSGGGAEPVYLYVLDHAIESDDTLPPIPEEFSGYHWEINDIHQGVSLTENGTALKFGELVSIIKRGSPIYVVDVAPEGGYGSQIQNVYELFMAENIYRYNDEEDYHVCALISSGNYTSVGVYAYLRRN